jgi:hypothetical protein
VKAHGRTFSASDADNGTRAESDYGLSAAAIEVTSGERIIGMTGYTVHTGSTIKFSQGWDLIFQGAQPKKTAVESVPKKSVRGSKAPKKTAVKPVKKTAVKVTKKKSSPATQKKASSKAVKKGK